MRAVVQRVTSASVLVAGDTVGTIDRGLLVYVGVAHTDNGLDVDYLAHKIVNLRIFDDPEGVMNLSLLDVAREGSASLLAVSQFTLFGDVRKGRRPSYNHAAPPDVGRARFEELVSAIREAKVHVETGAFGEHMLVNYTNDGPVTILVDSEKLF
jgi:D-tyrosyl-tRNA(Tyr) deacylase